MFDVHCHLSDKKFKTDVDEVITRAKEAGITRVVVLPEYPSQFEAVLDLKRKYPDFVIAGIGIHPIQKRNRSVKFDLLREVDGTLARFQQDVGCIGEVGLDFTDTLFKVSGEDKLIQEQVFREQIKWAKQYDLPLNCHSRSAEAETVRILLDEGYSRAVLHAFGGPPSLVLKAMQAGIYLSIPPIFSISEKGRALVEAVPLENLLLETDSPVLGVIKGERNEPANCLISAKFISEVKGISLEEVIEVTTKNAHSLFRL